MKCYKCGKEMTMDTRTLIGAQFKFDIQSSAALEFAKIQSGKYFEDITSKEGINFCFECYLDGLMIKAVRSVL